MCKLDLIFAIQRNLNTMIAKKNNLSDLEDLMDSDYGDSSVRRKWINRFADAMQSELTELTDSTKEWWWKESKFDVQNAKVELIDILHFWVSCCQCLGMEPSDVYDMYVKKNQVNIDRQNKGYRKKEDI